MGCASSKQSVCHKCQAPYSPVRRSHSMHWHHAPRDDAESRHVVALTSTTLGSLMLDPLNQNPINGVKEENGEGAQFETVKSVANNEFATGLTEAMTWSQMMGKKIPRTPAMTPSGEPETINAWELMQDLEDISPLKPRSHARSFSFHVSPNPIYYHQPIPMTKDDTEVAENESNSTSPSNDTSIGFASEFDPEVIATFRKALAELPPATPFRLKPLVADNIDNNVEVITEHTNTKPRQSVKNRVIVYFTSLRGVRRTYEDCCYVRTTLQGLGVKIDDRDVSMHSGFKEELKELLGEGYRGGLPRVFVGKKHIGGAEEIRRMHEDGELERLVECCERVEEGGDGDGGGGGNSGVCEACGDIRFVPCETCSGSCKIYCEGGNDNDGENEFGFQRCPDCNENGLIRCPICCE